MLMCFKLFSSLVNPIRHHAVVLLEFSTLWICCGMQCMHRRWLAYTSHFFLATTAYTGSSFGSHFPLVKTKQNFTLYERCSLAAMNAIDDLWHFRFDRVVWWHFKDQLGNIVNSLPLSNFFRIVCAKNYQNQCIFDRVIFKTIAGRFFGTQRSLWIW